MWDFANAHFFCLLVEVKNPNPSIQREKKPREAEHHKEASE
jgi:hypothetical protein